MRPGTPSIRNRIALALLVLALAVRVAVPAGWMPAQGQGFALTLCTGMGPASVWVDAKGQIHEGAPGDHDGGQATDHPCAFAGVGAPLIGGGIAPPPLFAPTPVDAPAPAPRPIAAIGAGLAAPPPPATGPPARI